jgi:hypothetical protein
VISTAKVIDRQSLPRSGESEAEALHVFLTFQLGSGFDAEAVFPDR